MDDFLYKGQHLYCEEVSLKQLAMECGTPLYVYSYNTLKRHYQVFERAFESTKHLICYAVKANGNLAIIRAIAKLGGGADVVSGGELFRCLEAGVPPQKIVFSGVGKSIQEIEYALRRKIFMINVESGAELFEVAHVAEALGVKAPISIRLNPDVDAKTHPYISTGLHENKFGLPKSEVMKLFVEAKNNPNLDPIGIDLHIGSQLLKIDPFIDALQITLQTIDELRGQGVGIRHLDFGGGLGVKYQNENPPSPKDYADAILPLLKNKNLELLIEPGRAMVANAGVLVTKVLYLKKTPKKNFVIVDAGMNDLLRPSLYKAEHEIVPVTQMKRGKTKVDVVGPICETGDFLAKDREMEETEKGEFLTVRTAGAYGFAMSSQYNARPRAAEVLVSGDKIDIVRERETFEDLIKGEKIPGWLEA